MPTLTDRQRAYREKRRRITVVLLAIWLVVTCLPISFAPALNRLAFFGFAIGFYIAAQGALIVYVVLVFTYAHYMNRLDREYGVMEEN